MCRERERDEGSDQSNWKKAKWKIELLTNNVTLSPYQSKQQIVWQPNFQSAADSGRQVKLQA